MVFQPWFIIVIIVKAKKKESPQNILEKFEKTMGHILNTLGLLK